MENYLKKHTYRTLGAPIVAQENETLKFEDFDKVYEITECFVRMTLAPTRAEGEKTRKPLFLKAFFEEGLNTDESMAARQAYINCVALTIESEMPIYENLGDNILMLTRVERDVFNKSCLEFKKDDQVWIKQMFKYFLVTPFKYKDEDFDFPEVN